MAFENLCANALAFGASSVLNGAYALFEFFVGAQQCPPEIVEPRRDVVRSLVPTLRAGLQRFVVAFLRFFKGTLQADEAAYGIAEVIEQLQGQQPRHAAIAIREGVDAQKIEDGQRRQHQGVGQMLVQSKAVARDQVCHRNRGKVCGDWPKANA